jgi:hypothetical protein
MKIHLIIACAIGLASALMVPKVATAGGYRRYDQSQMKVYSLHSPVRVRSYVRHNGQYVGPHFRTAPNHTKLDNWSTRGNVNPYTGRIGTKAPF